MFSCFLVFFNISKSNAVVVEKCLVRLLNKFITYPSRIEEKQVIEFYNLINKVRNNPSHVITKRQKVVLNTIFKNPKKQKQFLLGLRNNSMHLNYLKSFKSAQTVIDLGEAASKEKKLIYKILKNPNLRLSIKEQKRLSFFGMNAFHLRNIARTHGKEIIRLNKLIKAKNRGLIALFLVGAGQGYIQEESISKEEFKKIKPLQDDEIEIKLFDLHVTVRVGEDEYDYYMFSMRKNQLGKYENKNSTKIRLKLTRNEVTELKSFLENEVGAMGPYLFFPHVTSCISHINRAIEKTTSITVPAGVDRSPALTAAYFKARKLLCDPKVKQIYHVEGEKPIGNVLFDVIDSALVSIFLPDFLLAAQLDHFFNGYSVYIPEDKNIKEKEDDEKNFLDRIIEEPFFSD